MPFRREFGLEVATTSVDELLAAGVDGVVVSSPHRSPPRARGRGARGRRPRACREADDREAGRRTGDHGRPRTDGGPHRGRRLRLELRARLPRSGPRRCWRPAGSGRVTSVTAYKASSLTARLLGPVGVRRRSTSPGSPSRPRRTRGPRSNAGGGYLYGQLSHLLGLGLWLVPNEPEDVFARASFLPNGCRSRRSGLDRGSSDGVIALVQRSGTPPVGDPASFLRPEDRRRGGRARSSTWSASACPAPAPGRPRGRGGAPRGPRAARRGTRRAGLLVRRAGAVPRYTCLGPATCRTVRPPELGARAVAVMEAAWESARSREVVRIAELVA